MNTHDQSYPAAPAAAYNVEARSSFITKTYLHLFGAIGVFTLIEVFLFQSGLAFPIANAMMSVSWLFVLGGFVVVSWLASRVASTAASLPAQYAALAAIVVAVLFQVQLGVWFSIGMVALAGGAILYDTSNVLHHYPEDRYVGAALQLFASVALMFWYVLRLFMRR